MANDIQFGRANFSMADGLAECLLCEAMLTDALDGTLSAADQARFDAHLVTCSACAQMVADARRGAAWLEMLRSPRPEPPAELMQRILSLTSGAQTSGVQPFDVPSPEIQTANVLTAAPVLEFLPPVGRPLPVPAVPGRSNVLPFRTRFASAMRHNPVAQIMLQPRLAMTAAMAFFSIALTMNLTGVHLKDLRASDLRPSTLKRDFYTINASAARYYEGLRVVYELESRVHDLQSATEDDAPAGSTTGQPRSTQPSSSPNGSPSDGTPGKSSPADPNAAPQPDQKNERPQSKPGPGTSRSITVASEGGLV